MLAGALAYVAVIALIAMTILSAGLAMTRASIVRMAQPYLVTGYQRAVSALETTLSAEMQSGGIPNPTPTFTPVPRACADAACAYTTSETIVLTAAAATIGPTCNAAQTNCAPNVESNAYVSESRLTAHITVDVHNARGDVVATRSADVILRTFSAPPYVAVAGTRDGTFDDVAGSHTLGDDGGSPPETPDPCAASPAGATDDTAVRVAYQNAVTSRCTDGSSWNDASYGSNATPSGWSP